MDNGTEKLNSTNSGNLINHWRMNWTQFKDTISYMCFAGTMVAPWSLTQQVAGWQVWALSLQWQIFLLLNSANSVKTFRENSNVIRNQKLTVQARYALLVPVLCCILLRTNSFIIPFSQLSQLFSTRWDRQTTPLYARV